MVAVQVIAAVLAIAGGLAVLGAAWSMVTFSFVSAGTLIGTALLCGFGWALLHALVSIHEALLRRPS